MGVVSPLARFFLSPPACRNPRLLRAAVGGKTVLITGASYGIGEAAALLFAEAGAEVLLVARTAEKLAALAGQIREKGGRAEVFPADLYKLDEVPALAGRIQAAHPRIDVVVLNAGKSIRRRVAESFGRDDLGRSLALNFGSPAALLMALLPGMLERGEGLVINVSTVSARQPGAPRWGTYQGSKAGFDVWLRSVAAELRPRGVRVSSVYMPLVRTRMSAASGLYDRLPALSPLEAAQVLAYAAVRQPDRVAPWWLWWGELGALLLATPVNRALTWLDARMK